MICFGGGRMMRAFLFYVQMKHNCITFERGKVRPRLCLNCTVKMSEQSPNGGGGNNLYKDVSFVDSLWFLFNCEWALLVVTETGGEGLFGGLCWPLQQRLLRQPTHLFLSPRVPVCSRPAPALPRAQPRGGKKPQCLLCGLHIFSVFTSLGFLGWKLCLKDCSIWVGSKCLSMSPVILHTTAEVPESRCPVWPLWLPLKGIGVYPESPPS